MAEQSKGETEARLALSGLGLLLRGSWLGLNPSLSASSARASLLHVLCPLLCHPNPFDPSLIPRGRAACCCHQRVASCHSPALALHPVLAVPWPPREPPTKAATPGRCWGAQSFMVGPQITRSELSLGVGQRRGAHPVPKAERLDTLGGAPRLCAAKKPPNKSPVQSCC